MKATVRLCESYETILSALLLLRETPESFGPFVVIENEKTKRFVQFAGSDASANILFDVPPQEPFFPRWLQLKSADLNSLVNLAVRTLATDFRLNPEAELVVSSENTCGTGLA